MQGKIIIEFDHFSDAFVEMMRSGDTYKSKDDSIKVRLNLCPATAMDETIKDLTKDLTDTPNSDIVLIEDFTPQNIHLMMADAIDGLSDLLSGENIESKYAYPDEIRTYIEDYHKGESHYYTEITSVHKAQSHSRVASRAMKEIVTITESDFIQKFSSCIANWTHYEILGTLDNKDHAKSYLIPQLDRILRGQNDTIATRIAGKTPTLFMDAFIKGIEEGISKNKDIQEHLVNVDGITPERQLEIARKSNYLNEIFDKYYKQEITRVENAKKKSQIEKVLREEGLQDRAMDIYLADLKNNGLSEDSSKNHQRIHIAVEAARDLIKATSGTFSF